MEDSVFEMAGARGTILRAETVFIHDYHTCDGVYSGYPVNITAEILNGDMNVLSEYEFTHTLDPHDVTFWAIDNGFEFTDPSYERLANRVIDDALITRAMSVGESLGKNIQRLVDEINNG